jgi:hypothetical protein
MDLHEFETGYWYADELKDFACELGVPDARKLRKDEIEKAIVAFLRTGAVALPTRRPLRKTGIRDLERGLTRRLRVWHYTSNRQTKSFLRAEAQKLAPEVREKSGVWYRLNRWREEQTTKGKRITYGDLVRQYIALNRKARFEKVPQARYVNFVAEFLATTQDATRSDAIAAWAELKTMRVPKDYASWAKASAKRTRNRK